MRKIMFAISLVLLGGLLGAVAAGASDSAPVSWGKLHISYEQYRAEAQQCAYVGLDAALNQKPPVVSTRVGDTADDFLLHSQFSALHALKLQKDAGYAAMTSCLTELGYHPFRLTDEQAAHLKALATSAEDRHQYLYSLAVDPNILAGQGVASVDTSRR